MLAPLTPHGPVVRGEGWSENESAALTALGVWRLDEGEVAAAAAAHKKFGTYVRPASAAGRANPKCNYYIFLCSSPSSRLCLNPLICSTFHLRDTRDKRDTLTQEILCYKY
jgi:hypothetical protein